MHFVVDNPCDVETHNQHQRRQQTIPIDEFRVGNHSVAVLRIPTEVGVPHALLDTQLACVALMANEVVTAVAVGEAESFFQVFPITPELREKSTVQRTVSSLC